MESYPAQGMIVAIIALVAAFVLLTSGGPFTIGNPALATIGSVSTKGLPHSDSYLFRDPIVGYMGMGSGLKGIRCSDPACTNPRTPFTLATGSFPAVTLRDNDLPFFVYNDAQGKLMAASCRDAGCAQFNPVVLSTTPTGSVKAVTFRSGSHPLVAFSDTTANQTTLIHCGDAACQQDNVQVSMASAADSISLALGQDDYPLLLLRMGESLRVVKCDDTLCTQYHINTLAERGIKEAVFATHGDSTRVAYSDGEGTIHVLTCKGLDCATFTDTKHSTGTNLAMAIPSDGRAVISYTRTTNGTPSGTYLLRCDDPTCASSTPTRVDASGRGMTLVYATETFPLLFYNADIGGTPYLMKASCSNATCSRAEIKTLDTIVAHSVNSADVGI